ncbi:hypothetical protein EJ08DRAFT_295596 [Tothia fuscella]|uniref:Uncharacterized protein n=1 Tax=Tothia fuscella TaxID=1048955 RepID=A0A9P4U3T4_9PEZI|nr:hypothetical protein EJ08DRAFT_295596 [Tothia fuscella]
MASVESVIKRLGTSATTALTLSNKFYKVVQEVPAAVFEYTDFAEQILYIAAYLESLGQVIPTLDLQDGSKVFDDIVRLLDFLDDAVKDSEPALPRPLFDGGAIDMILPYEVDNLLHQLEALGVASNLILAVLQLGAQQKFVFGPNFHPSAATSRRITEGFVNQARRMVRTLKLSQPLEINNPGRRFIAPRRAKAHTGITEFLNQMLHEIVEETFPKAGTEADSDTKTKEIEKSSDKGETEESKKVNINTVNFEHFGRDPIADGMPAHVRHNPDQVYAKIHKKDLDERTLDFYGLPWSMVKDDPNYFIIWKPMEIWECDNLFDHTKKLRINEEQASINVKAVVRMLLNRWTNVETNLQAVVPTPQDDDFRCFEKVLQELVKQDEKPIRDVFNRPIIRERSFSPPRRMRSYSPPRVSRAPMPVARSQRIPPHQRHGRPIYRDQESKTEYWRPWGDQIAQLYSSLKYRGWQPVYMRGTDAGQTWFYGPDVVHVRRFKDDYTPQEGAMKPEDGITKTQEYLIISTEWIEEEALARIGFQYQLLETGFYSLDPRITWGDIELLLGATSTFREERLYRKYRSLPNGDLYESREIAVPGADFLHGPKLVGGSKKKQREEGDRRAPSTGGAPPPPPPPPPPQQSFRGEDDGFNDAFVEVSSRM